MDKLLWNKEKVFLNILTKDLKKHKIAEFIGIHPVGREIRRNTDIGSYCPK